MNNDEDTLNVNLSYYNLMVKRIAKERDPTNITTVEVTFSNSIYGVEPKVEKFITDLELMDTIRNSHDPAIKDAFEGLLTTMALVNGRNANEVPVMDEAEFKSVKSRN